MALIVAGAAPASLDHKVAAREDMASEEDIQCRTAAVESEVCCFITFLSLHDADEAVLGLGLKAHPRSARQNSQRLPSDLELVFDYIDVEAFNTGVGRAMATEGHVPDTIPFIVSSGRRQINAWLPLYFNAQHWSRAKPYCVSAFRLLAGCKPGVDIRPRDILNVCCGLLTSAITGFTKGQSEFSTPRTAERGKGSEKGMQMYADVHRLFLQMAHEYPSVRRLAKQRLQNFIQEPAARTRARTSCLGSLVHCLLVVEDVLWEDLAPTLIPEAFRRHVIRQEAKGYCFDSRWCAESTDQLISLWDYFAPQAGVVIAFFVIFYHRVGRPMALTIEDVECKYDRRWGRLPDDAKTELLDMCSHLRQQASAADLFPLMFPWTTGGPQSLKEVVQWAETHSRASISSSLCEIILWAEKYGRCNGAIVGNQWPALHGPYELLTKWWEACQRRACWRQIQPAQPRQRQWPPKARESACGHHPSVDEHASAQAWWMTSSDDLQWRQWQQLPAQRGWTVDHWHYQQYLRDLQMSPLIQGHFLPELILNINTL